MAKFDRIINHVTTWEGGHSADPRDNALKYGDSGVLGKGYDNRFPNNYVHTNKGIIWQTYVAYCNKKGITPSSEQFLNMDMRLWKDIAYTLYWKPYLLDYVNSQAIAEIVFEGYWGGGGAGLVRSMQEKLNEWGFKGANGKPLALDGAMGNNSVFALNNATKSYAKEKELIKYMTDERLRYLQGRSDWSWAGKGWANRVKAMFDNAMKVAAASRNLKVALIGGLFFLTYKTLMTHEKKYMWGGSI